MVRSASCRTLSTIPSASSRLEREERRPLPVASLGIVMVGFESNVVLLSGMPCQLSYTSNSVWSRVRYQARTVPTGLKAG